MALSRTTSRLFSKAPTYTRPSQNPAVGAASGYGDAAQYRAGQTLRQFGQMPSMQQVPPVPAPAAFVGPQNPMQPPVNMSGLQGAPMVQGMGVAGLMSGLQGAPMVQGMGVAGLMPGFGGMAALGKGYSASLANPMPNPMMSQALPGQGEAVRRLNAINDTPSPMNSLQASAISQGNPMSSAIAGMSNGYYSPPSSVNQGRQYGLTLPMDLAGQQNRIANQNPMYAGMQSRFGAGSVLGQQAAMIAAGDAGVAAGTHIRIPGGYGEMPTYIQITPEKYQAFMENLMQQRQGELTNPEARGVFAFRNADGGMAGGNRLAALRAAVSANPDAPETAGLKQALAVEESRMQDLSRQRAEQAPARRAASATRKLLETNRRADVKFKHLVSRGLNPNSAKAKAMFPEQVAKMQGMSPNNPMAPQPGSVEASVKAAGDAANREATNPVLIGMGYEPGSGVGGLHTSLDAYLTGNPDASLSDADLKTLQDHLNDNVTAVGETAAFDSSNFNSLAGMSTQGDSIGEYYSNLWRGLAAAGDDPKKRADWFARYKNRQAGLEAAMRDQFGYEDPLVGQPDMTGGKPPVSNMPWNAQPKGQGTAPPPSWYPGGR